MAKKRYRSLPKRIAGIKVPKGLRRYADTPLGSAIIAEALVEFGKDALGSPALRAMAGDIRHQVTKTSLGVAAALQHAADRAGERYDDSRKRSKRRNDLSTRLEQDEM